MNELKKVHLTALVEHWDENPNHMSEENYAALVASIRADGFLQPILVCPSKRKGWFDICDGHHRVKAAREAGLVTIDAVCTEVAELKGAALGIGMNRRRGELDLAEVAREAHKLVEAGWTMADMVLSTGFDAEELDALLKTSQPEQDDIMGGTIGPIGGDEDEPEVGAYHLDLVFDTKADLARARAALKRRTPPRCDLSGGLLVLIGEAE
jgi:hypothetical protein